VLFEGNAQEFKAIKVDVLDVMGSGLNDNLILIISLQAVGILGVATILRSAGRLDIGDAPGIIAEGTEESGGMHSSRSNLNIVRLEDEATLINPKLVQFAEKGLKFHLIF
jgi:hypothetical protein